jgi:hypothetical protein
MGQGVCCTAGFQAQGSKPIKSERATFSGLPPKADFQTARFNYERLIWGHRNLASLVRIASPLRADMIFGEDMGAKCVTSSAMMMSLILAPSVS